MRTAGPWRSGLCAALLVLAAPARADDAAAARLLRDGRAAEAAELFDDPAWRGIALFRSDQLPQAALAFARAGDAASLHNLAAVYVVLGYLNLAVDAYQRSLALDPGATETRDNLAMLLDEIRRRRARENGQAGEQPEARELATLEPVPEKQQSGPPKQPGADVGARDEAKRPDQKPGPQGQAEQKAEQGGTSAGGQGRQADAPSGDAPGGAGDGRETPQGATDDGQAAAGRAESEAVSGAPPRSARQALDESRRATERWLAGIEDRSPALAAKRIAAESARRRARDGPLPEPEDPW